MRTQLEERSIGFGVGVIKFIRTNPELLTKRTRDQLVSSRTSIGANIAEARSGQSRADFINKMEVALKESRETDYWLTVASRVDEKYAMEVKDLLRECGEITAMLVASVKTAKANRVVNSSERRV